MILVLTGTQNISFVRMISSIIDFAESNPDIFFFIQGGPYVSESLPNNVCLKSYTSNEDMLDLIEQSDFVVTHAGTGSIVTSLLKGKKVIVMPRMKKYYEHNDNHQVEIAEIFSSQDLVIYWNENEGFSKVFNKVKNFTPKRYQSGFESLSGSIERYILSIGL